MQRAASAWWLRGGVDWGGLQGICQGAGGEEGCGPAAKPPRPSDEAQELLPNQVWRVEMCAIGKNP
eukprot:453807-Pelagomonas_calceolata.AAC.3